jgi:hypothetical protein
MTRALTDAAPKPTWALATLARLSAGDAAARRVFDGRGAAEPDAALGGFALGWLGRLVHDRGLSEAESMGRKAYKHPEIPGAAVSPLALDALPLDRPLPEASWSGAALTDPSGPSVAARLGELGLGPRLLGAGVVTRGQRRLRLGVREQVRGFSVHEEVFYQRFGPAELALVEDWLARAAAAGWDVYAPWWRGATSLVLGVTDADPRRRAYLVSSDGFTFAPRRADGRGITLLLRADWLDGLRRTAESRRAR